MGDSEPSDAAAKASEPVSPPGWPSGQDTAAVQADSVRRVRSRRWLVAGSAAMVLVVAAIVPAVAVPGHTRRSAIGSTPGTKALTGVSRPTPAASPAPMAIGDGRTLLAHVLAPARGSHELAMAGSTDGVYSADQFAHEFLAHNAVAAAIALSKIGYATAAGRTWYDDTKTVDIEIIQFADVTGAQKFFQDQRREFAQSLGVNGDVLVVGLAEANRIEFSKAAGSIRDVLICRDANIVVVINTHRATTDADADVALLMQQLTDLADAA